jgi:hypothetical protein
MSDYMLRTETEAQMDDALEAAGILVEVDQGEGEMVLMPVPNCALDRIGPIPPVLDEDGNEIRPGDPRYHTNLRVAFELTEEQVEALPTFTPEPGIPYRVWA